MVLRLYGLANFDVGTYRVCANASNKRPMTLLNAKVVMVGTLAHFSKVPIITTRDASGHNIGLCLHLQFKSRT